MDNSAPPESKDVHLALERIIASETFSRSKRSRELLTHLVTETLEGRAEYVKGFSIAVEVFGRDASFDPDANPLVRVQAGRVREFLKSYYLTDGRLDPIEISLPKGGYVPTFSVRSSDPANVDEPTQAPDESAPPYLKFAVMAAFGVLILLQTYSIWHHLGGTDGLDPITTQGVEDARPAIIRILVPPDSGNELDKTVLLTGRDIISRFDQFTVVVRPESEDVKHKPWPEDYRIRASSARHGNEATVTMQAMHLDSGEVIARKKVTVQLAKINTGNLQDLVPLANALASLLQENGAIVADYTLRKDYSPVMACRVAMIRYYQEQTDVRHERARKCAEDAIASGVVDPGLYVVLSYMHREEHTDQRNVRDGLAMERALAAAKKAVELGPSNAQSHFVLMGAYSQLGLYDLMIKEGRAAVALNPTDATVLSGFASRLNYRGEFAEALGYLNRAEELSLVHPNWRRFSLFLANYGLDRFPQANAHANSLSGSQNPLYLAALAVSAKHNRDQAKAKRFLAALRKADPRFTHDPRAMFERRNYAKPLIDRLVADLRSID